ncbi:MAG: hypothetical protein FJ161_04980 [Gammaproteobacteria bacterium]|nr:hypothetical protein [Gammaproteobacteria bacterium]
MRRFLINKLIRDRMCEYMTSRGYQYTPTIMEQPEYIAKLRDKISEEAQEVFDAQSREELIVELADLCEVIECLCEAENISELHAPKGSMLPIKQHQ